MTTRLDPRVVRTRQALRDAFIALILDKGYDAISIQDITDRAGLRRATFYLHYKDKEELMLSMLREVFDGLVERLECEALVMLTPNGEVEAQRIMFEETARHANLYRALLAGQGANVFTRYARDYIAAEIRAELTRMGGSTSVPVDVLATYLATIKLNMIIWWLEQDMRYSPESMAQMWTSLILHGVSGALQESATPTTEAI